MCVTTKDDEPTLYDSLQSAERAFDPDVTIVTSANLPGSTARSILETWRSESPDNRVIVHIHHESTRGKGRRLAAVIAEDLGADELVQSVDTDILYDPEWIDWDLIQRRPWRDYWFQSVGWNICPRELYETIGPWPDWQVLEDRAMWVRAADQGLFAYYPMDSTNHHQARTWFSQRVENAKYLLTALGKRGGWRAWRFDPMRYNIVGVMR